ncbi:MAG: 16S rRNA (guanine(966)-N(2))-methyltransferase RsmD [Gammaproteobacteria bacterium]
MSVAADPLLRPTPDRVRETLFNWLRDVIEGAECLDLFAGTGALGFEALSRGAARVVMIEQNASFVAGLEQQARTFGTDRAEIVCSDALNWLQANDSTFDLIFLDPPFTENLLGMTCDLLVNRGHLRPGGRVYAESGPGVEIVNPSLHAVKQSRAGRVQYMLLEAGTEEYNE